MTAGDDTRDDRIGLGILLMMGCVASFAGVNVLAKLLAERSYPVAEIALFRNACALIPVAMLLRGDGLSILRTRRLSGHLWRGLTGMAAMFCLFYAFGELPLADTLALSFVGPLLVTALSVPLLGETVGGHRWAAVCVGFIGVLMMTGPTGALSWKGTAAALAFALLYALAQIAIRQLTRTESTRATVIYFSLIASLGSGVACLFSWKSPEAADLPLLVGCGLCGGVGQLFLTESYRHAAPSLLGPFSYAALIFGAGFDWLFWGALPHPGTLAGAVVVVGAGLYVWHRERLLSRPKSALQQ
jgi:drug/metabolite transporter (DMT)-like permease